MSVIRAFIAIDLSQEIQSRLESVSDELQNRVGRAPVRWVPTENIHLTLKFLGDVSVANLEVLKKILAAETQAHHPFEMSVGELGAYPSLQRPRVLWVGVEAPPELQSIQRGIENETARLGYDREKRAFSAHLTIGRISRNATSKDVRRIGETLSAYKLGFLGATRVKEVKLFQSDLRPGGAVYTCISAAALGPGA